MPIKYNLTKFDMLAQQIRALSMKKCESYTKQEQVLIAMAKIIASFGSRTSWPTYRIITSGGMISDPLDLKNDFTRVKSGLWKQVSPLSIQEIAGLNVSTDFFYKWLHYNVERGEAEVYKQAWVGLRAVFDEICDEVERART